MTTKCFEIAKNIQKKENESKTTVPAHENKNAKTYKNEQHNLKLKTSWADIGSISDRPRTEGPPQSETSDRPWKMRLEKKNRMKKST